MADAVDAEQQRSVSVTLTEDEWAAVDGWRQANRFDSVEQAMRELIRMSLLEEIGRVYRAAAEDGGIEATD